MRVEVQLDEVIAFVKGYYNISVGLKYIPIGKIEVKYIVSADLSIKELKNDVLTIRYKANGVVDIIAKGVNYFMGSKLNKTPFEWNPKASEIIINLKEIRALENLFKYFQVTDVLFIKKNILVILNTRSTTYNN